MATSATSDDPASESTPLRAEGGGSSAPPTPDSKRSAGPEAGAPPPTTPGLSPQVSGGAGSLGLGPSDRRGSALLGLKRQHTRERDIAMGIAAAGGGDGGVPSVRVVTPAEEGRMEPSAATAGEAPAATPGRSSTRMSMVDRVASSLPVPRLSQMDVRSPMSGAAESRASRSSQNVLSLLAGPRSASTFLFDPEDRQANERIKSARQSQRKLEGRGSSRMSFTDMQHKSFVVGGSSSEFFSTRSRAGTITEEASPKKIEKASSTPDSRASRASAASRAKSAGSSPSSYTATPPAP